MTRRPLFTPAATSRPAPRPVPDPAAVAAGESLRAILLAQIDAVERRWVAVRAGEAPPNPTPGMDADLAPQLRAYWLWCQTVLQSAVVEESGEVRGYFHHNALLFLTPDDLRDPATLDVYVSGTPWAGQAGPWI